MNRHTERIGDRIAEEAQLLAEEKWIIEALTKIKTQRNCLQIERLQLESLESKLRQKQKYTSSESQNNGQTNNAAVQGASLVTKSTAPIRGSTRNSIEFEVPLITENPVHIMDLDACNDEELDLAVSTSVFSHEFKKNVLEEYEEEDDDDMFIDMNMFMNSKSSCGK